MTDPLIAYLEPRLDEYLAELTAVAGMDSYSLQPEDVNHVVDWLQARLEQLGCTVTRYPQPTAGDNLRADKFGSGSGRITLLGHSDTVFPRGTTAQRPVTVDGDTVLGPGTCDMKAGLLLGIYAVEALDALGFTDYERVTFLIVSDEELDERSSIPLIREVCRESDAVLTLEAARANGDIVTARKGVYAYTAKAFGRSAHSGVEPEKGRSAILALSHQVIALHALNDPEHGISLNVGKIEGGRQRNVVPDAASVEFEARAFTRADLAATADKVQALFAQQPIPGVTFEVSYEPSHPPMPRTDAVAKLENMAISIGAKLGFSLRGASTGGAADAAFAVDEGVPALDGMGPIGGLDHGPDEYILKSSIVPRTALLARLIMAIPGAFGAAG